MNMNKRAIVCVTNDLVTDQRVHKSCIALQKVGYEVLEVGRLLPDSLPLERSYQIRRTKLFFNKGGLFYAEYNIRLFFFLLFAKVDLIFSNDLDTLPAAYFASKIRGKEIIYDSHEYFTEVPELVNRKHIQRVWELFEKFIFPKLKRVITVNKSIADLYEKKYKNKVFVIRNIPPSYEISPIEKKSRKELGLPENKKIIIIQGTGINIDRGAEEACLAMQYIDNAILLIIGKGDAFPSLKKIVSSLQLQDKIIFKDRMPSEILRQYTMNCDLGLAIDKGTNLNYQLALPNKLFDYIHAGIPILSTEMVELKNIIEEYQIGYFIKNHNPKDIANTINYIFADNITYNQKRENTVKAKQALYWEKEEDKLIAIIIKDK